jgi:hypothetical protein
MKKVLMALVILGLILLTVPVFAEESVGMHGEVGTAFDLAGDDTGESWLVDVHYNFTSWLALGAAQTTGTNGFRRYGFIPDVQVYEIYALVRPFEGSEVRLVQWCIHPVYSGTPIKGDVTDGLRLELSYKW